MNNSTNLVLMACVAVTMFGQNAASYLVQGDTQVKAGQYRQAAASYRQAISLDPRNPQAYEKLGDVYGRLGMPGEAATVYEKAADLMLATPAPRQVAPNRPHVETQPAQVAANRPAPLPAGGNGGGGGGLEGLYFMTRVWQGSDLETATYWFHNATVVLNPVSSTKNLDAEAERTTHPNDVGKYRLQAGQLAIMLPNSNHDIRFEPMDHGCFGWDAGIFCPVEIFKPGATLDGTYSGGVSVGGGAAMSSTTITFNRDGSYQSQSVNSFSSKGGRTEVSGGSVGTERGKYRIDGTALHIIPDGGKERVLTTFPYGDGKNGPAPENVYFGGGMIKRVK